MKKVLQTFSLYFLSALIVLSSSAWKFSTFYCELSGFAHYNFGLDSDSCDGNLNASAQTTLEASCCNQTSIEFGYDLSTSKKPVNQKLQASTCPSFHLTKKLPSLKKYEHLWGNAPSILLPTHKDLGVYLI